MITKPGSPARLVGRNLQIGKVALGARSDPQCDSSVPRVEFEIIHDQAGLLRAVHVEPRFAAFHLDLVLGPDSGLQIDVRLILFRSLLPRSGKSKSGYEPSAGEHERCGGATDEDAERGLQSGVQRAVGERHEEPRYRG
ncbi:MAG: hypothetical protein DMG98_10735, partial [Acidobacteria bacterium]